MGLSELVLKGIRRKGYRLPTPIQRKSIPLVLQGLDVVGMARTGSGKTAAFVIPMLEKLKAHVAGSTGPRAVLLAPTRELALQTHKVVKELGRYMDLRTAVLVGGDSIEAQFTELAASPDIVVATPGRLMHHLSEIAGFSLKSVEFAVFDEADRLFEMGFAEQLRHILSSMSSSRQTLLFSATLPKLLAEFARAGLRDAELVRLDTETKLSPDLSVAFFTVRQEDKPAALLFTLKELIPEKQSTIVFTATRHHVELLAGLLRAEGLSVAAVHGNMDQAARKIAIAKFRAGKASILVVTDVAARGIDIPLLDNVVNYDFPPKPKLFVHRAGRAARAGRMGTAYSLATRDELGYVIDLHLFLSKPIAPAPIRGLAEAAAAVSKRADSDGEKEASYFGCFPQVALDGSIEHLRQVFESSPDLSSQKRAADNAMKLYIRTRPPASPESVRRAKALVKEGVHPLLAAAVPSHTLGGLEAQECLASITEKLRSYRPSATVFEHEVAPARAGQGAGSMAIPGISAASHHGRRLEVMKRKRETHEDVIEGRKRLAGFKSLHTQEEAEGQRTLEATSGLDDSDEGDAGASDQHDIAHNGVEDTEYHSESDIEMDMGSGKAAVAAPGTGPTGRFREEGFFISHAPSDNASSIAERYLAVGSGDRFRDAVLDLTNEQDVGTQVQHKRTLWHWDAKAKKYVKLQKGESVTAGKRVMKKGKTSDATHGEENAGGLYAKWAKKTKLSIGKKSSATFSEKGAAQLADAMKGRFRRGGRGWVNPLKPRENSDALGAGRSDVQEGKGKRGRKGLPSRLQTELKNPDQVRKQRKMEGRKRELSATNHPKKKSSKK